MSGIRAGNIYYTVGIDKASLAALKREVKAIGDAAKGSSQGLASINPELAKLAAKSTDVSNRMRTLNNDFKGNRRESQEFKDGMRALGVEAGRLRDEVAALGPDIINSDRAMALASGTTSKLAGVMTQAAQVTGHMGNSSEMLGDEVVQLMRAIDAINTEIRTLSDELSVGAITTKQFSAAMATQEGNLESARASFNKMNTAVEKTDGSSKQLRDTQRKLSITTRLMATENSKATGKINQMAMAQKLSYGATTLLNDRIFQLSPALGILTNQLIFTTNGFKAFLTAALPIVAVAGTLIGIFTTMVVSLKSAVGLEAALADVRKTTNLASDELKEITQTFQDLSKEIPITVMELLDIATVAGQLGIVGARNIEKFSETVAKLAIATDVVGEEGATSLARFLQATGTAMDDMGTEAERVANVLNQLENTSAATAAEILQMTSYTQGLASQAGLTTDEILAINAALLSLGVKAEAGGSAVVRTMSKIQVAASTGGRQLERFAENANMTTEEFRVMVKESPLEALEALAQGMKETADNGGDLNDVLIEMGINEVRERRALLALAQGADTLSTAIENARRESFEMASLSAEVAIQADTVRSKFVLLGNRFIATGQDIGMFLLPALHAVLDVLIALTDNMDGVVSVAGAAALALGVRGLAGAFTVAATAGTGLLAIFRAFLGPVGLVTAGLGLLTAGWQLWANAQEDASTATEEVAEEIEELEAKLDSAASVFARVRDKNDLVYAMEAVSRYLDGDASRAWDDYKDKVIENIETVEDLEVAITEAMQALIGIETQAARSALRASEAVIREYIASSDVLSKVFGSGPLNLGDPAAFRAELESALSGFRTGNTGRIPMFEDGDLAPYEIEELARGVGTLIGLTEDLEGNQLRYNAAVAEGADSVAFLQSLLDRPDTAPPPGETPPGTERDPVKDVLDRFQQSKDTALWFFESPDTSIVKDVEDYYRQVVAAGESAMTALANIMNDPNVTQGVRDAAYAGLVDVIGKVDGFRRALGETESAAAQQARTLEMLRYEYQHYTDVVEDAWPSTEGWRETLNEGTEAAEGNAIALEMLRKRAIHWADEVEDAYPSTEAFWDFIRDRAIKDAEQSARSVEMARVAHEKWADEVEETYPSTEAAWKMFKSLREAAEDLAGGVEVLEMQYRVGLIDAADVANGKIQLQQAYIKRLADTYDDDMHPAVVAATEDLAEMNEELRLVNELSDALVTSATAVGAAMDARAARGFSVNDETAQADWGSGTTPAIQAVQREVALLTQYLARGEGPGPMLLAAFRELQALAPEVASGFNELARELLANELAAKLVVDGMAEIRNEEDELQAQWGGEPAEGEGKGTGEVTTSPGRGELTRVGFDLGFVDNVKAAFLSVAQSSDVVGAALDSFAMETDKSGNIVGMSFDPMMMLVQIIGKVLSKSEGFATALETLDKVLDPLVDIVDALFTALQPIIEVAVALVQSALKPFVMIVENVLAPVLTALANIVKAVWNALASFLFWLERIEDEPEGDDGAPIGSISWARAGLANAQRMYEEAVTQAMREALKAHVEFWEGVVDQMEGVETPQPGSLAYMRDELSKLREQYEWATSDEERQLLLEQIRLLEEQIKATEAIAESEDPDKQVQAGTNISEITGPTRDLLIDLLTPLSILPSWTSMIQDIRNDVRSIAMANYGMATPSFSTASINTQGIAAAGTNYTFQNVTITTNATSVQDLVRDISKFTYKERRGGK